MVPPKLPYSIQKLCSCTTVFFERLEFEECGPIQVPVGNVLICVVGRGRLESNDWSWVRNSMHNHIGIPIPSWFDEKTDEVIDRPSAYLNEKAPNDYCKDIDKCGSTMITAPTTIKPTHRRVLWLKKLSTMARLGGKRCGKDLERACVQAPLVQY